MNQSEVEKIVAQLELLPHPEGGFYKEVYRSEGVIPQQALGNEFSGDRNYCTSIYFLITSSNFSAFHRIKQDEIWHFYGGVALNVHVINQDGDYTCHKVGMDMENGEVPQLVVPAGCWFASDVSQDNAYSFVGCTVAPGFDFADFELANRNELQDEYPQHQKVIETLTRE